MISSRLAFRSKNLRSLSKTEYDFLNACLTAKCYFSVLQGSAPADDKARTDGNIETTQEQKTQETQDPNDTNLIQVDGAPVPHLKVRREATTDDDPESHLIVVTYDSIIASCHEDGMIRFWDLEVSDFHFHYFLKRQFTNCVNYLFALH